MRVKAALRSTDLVSALTTDRIEPRTSDKVLSMIISALGDNFRRAVQERTSAETAWKKLHERYAGTSMVNKLSVLNVVLNIKLNFNENMGNHEAIAES